MSGLGTPTADGFSWSGRLDETNVHALYAACYSVRFSGVLELSDTQHAAKVVFLGGDPVEIAGGDTETISLWSQGSFRAIQCIPDLEGDLTTHRELGGSLSVTRPPTLWAWISEYRLTCEIELECPDEKAVVRFQHGHAESAEVNGLPELAALARVSSWTNGSFCVRLRPLFPDGRIPAIPATPELSAPVEPGADPKQFDVSQAVEVNQSATPWPTESNGLKRALGESTNRPVPSDYSAVAAMQREAAAGEKAPPPSKGKTLPWIVAGLVLGAGAGVGALYHYGRPPFSPASRGAAAPATTVLLPATTVAPSVAAPAAAPPAMLPGAPSSAPAVLHESPRPTLEPHSTAPRTEPEKSSSQEKLLQRSRLLLITGHPKPALELIRRGMKQHPKDAALRLYEQQALGKLGRAELLLEGKGNAMIDGKKFVAPKKLKLSAGPHVFDLGEGEHELTLKRGEKRRLRIKR